MPSLHQTRISYLHSDDSTCLQIDKYLGDPTMTVQWHCVALKLLGWLCAEMALNAIGLDHLADFSEFRHDRQHVAVVRLARSRLPTVLSLYS